MRVLQLIDSLEAGGAERMAVNLANALGKKISFSGLIATREEGSLKKAISPSVNYAFLNKKKTIDFNAVLKLRAYLKKNKIEIIHAHSSSYFIALFVKCLYPKIKVFWHDHNGNRASVKKGNGVLKFASFFFKGIFTVNEELKTWAIKHLRTKNVQFIPNFSLENYTEEKSTFLKGEKGKRIVCLANLRHPKNHLFLVNAFKESVIQENGWTLHLVGNQNETRYVEDLKQFVLENNLKDVVFFYGSCNDVSHILSQVEIGVLASTYEGFPVTLLEYGLAKLAVLSTNVGYCKNIIINKQTGYVFDPMDSKSLVEAFVLSTNNLKKNELLAVNLYNYVQNNFAADMVLQQLMHNYKN